MEAAVSIPNRAVPGTLSRISRVGLLCGVAAGKPRLSARKAHGLRSGVSGAGLVQRYGLSLDVIDFI